MESNLPKLTNPMEMYYYHSIQNKNSKNDADQESTQKTIPLISYQPYHMDPVSSLLQGNSYLLAERIECLKGQIRARQDLQNSHIYDILDKICDVDSRIMNLDNLWGMRFDPVISKERQGLESELAGLEREERHLQAMSWSDISRLYLMLKETALEYVAAKQQEEFTNM